MSAIRVYGPDGRPTWRKFDDGAVGRITHAKTAIRGSGLVVASMSPVDDRTPSHRDEQRRSRKKAAT
jgi:hypothetical protein